jgi:hypothetical protein
MKFFHQLAAGLDVGPLMHALARQPELWNQNTLRTAHPGTAHAAVSDIWLWFNEVPLEGTTISVAQDREVIAYPAWEKLPQAREIIFNLMRRVEGVRLGRVIITKLPPGKIITPHVDGGAPATFYTRYQIALQSLPGALFHIDDETAGLQTGEVWMIDNSVEHSVVNNSADDRVVMIVDIRNG